MVNDTSIIAGIFIFFIAAGILMPYVSEAFTGRGTASAVDIIEFPVNNTPTGETECRWTYTGAGFPLGYQLICGLPKDNSINLIDITKSIGKMFFWTFGAIPELLDLLLFVPLRFLLLFLLYRAARSGGG